MAFISYDPVVTRRVLIIQPYIPEYRVPLFSILHTLLREDDIDLQIAHGDLRASQATRGDAHELPFSLRVKARHPRAGNTYVRHRRVSTRGIDLVVAEHALGAIDTYEMLGGRRVRTAVWGHARPLTDMERPMVARLARWQIARAAHFFAYTETDRDLAINWGADRHAITALNNTTDTRDLRARIDAVTPAEVETFKRTHGIGDGPVLLALGALDPSKRPSSIFRIVESLRDRVPGLQLVVAGNGPERALVEEYAAAHSWVRYIGRAGREDLAALSHLAVAIVNPGLVGLVAVDSFAMQTPIVTTAGTHHAPEFSYLADRVNAVIVDDNETAMRNALREILDDQVLQEKLRAGCRESADQFSIEAMAGQFRDGVLAALDTR